MPEYRLTSKGKFVLGLFILVLVLLIVYSGSYIVRYVVDVSNNASLISETNEPLTNEEAGTNTSSESIPTDSSEAATQTSEATIETSESTNGSTEPTVETTEVDNGTLETIYTIVDLEDLKQFKLIFYFSKDSDTIAFSDADLSSIKAMMLRYPNEKIAIEGYVNGYPKYETNESTEALSLSRALVIKEALEEIGVDKSLLSVYNFGSESPLFTDFGNQHKNDRVEVYFSDHYIKASQGK